MEIEVRSARPRRALQLLVSTISLLATLAGVALLLPSLLGFQRYVITGTSMTGTIDRGSLVFEEVVPVADLQVGDIITYTPPVQSGVDHPVTHRIVSIHKHEYRTKGDAVPQRDPWKFQLQQSEQAREKFSVPYVGYVFLWVQDRQTRLWTVTLPAALITLMGVAQLLRVLRPKRPKRPKTPPSPTQPPTVATSS